MPAPRTAGRLILMPNTLDLGTTRDQPPAPLGQVLPTLAITTAATLRHWVVENAKSARAFLKRVEAEVALAVPLQQMDIRELPRPPKGGHPAGGKPAALSPDALRPLLQPALDGHDIGLLSEAGLPAVADPGAPLVRAAHAAGVEVLPLSGPSSLMLALAASGLNGQSFAFIGYLPQDKGERAQRLRELEAASRRAAQTQLVIETPYRNAALLDALIGTLAPSTQLSVSVGLTLPGGFTRTDTVAAWRRRLAESLADMPADVPAVFAFLA
ncbi:MAG: SAM-dependent methyltransferase [Aquabacterium sp.]|nr:SAM-dependent methyltransferase [Aquabacterium sp.]